MKHPSVRFRIFLFSSIAVSVVFFAVYAVYSLSQQSVHGQLVQPKVADTYIVPSQSSQDNGMAELISIKQKLSLTVSSPTTPHIDDLIKSLQTRSKRLHTLAMTEPKKFLAQATLTSDANWNTQYNRLPQSLQQRISPFIERSIKEKGNLETIIAESFKSSKPFARYTLLFSPQNTDKKFTMYIAHKNSSVELSEVQTAAISGIALDNIIVVDSMQSVQPLSTIQAVTTGTIKTLTILFTFKDKTDIGAVPSVIQGMIYGPLPPGASGQYSLDSYLQTESYGKINISGQVVGPYQISVNSGSCGDANNQHKPVLSWINLALQEAGIDTSKFTHFIFISPSLPCDISGLAWPNRNTIYLNGTFGMTNTTGSNFLTTLHHEWGHLLTLGHTASLYCGFVSMDDYSSCAVTEYGDILDPMSVDGGGGLIDYNAGYKNAKLSWLPDAYIKVLKPQSLSPGIYEIAPLEDFPFNHQAKLLKILKDQSTADYYYLEYRRRRNGNWVTDPTLPQESVTIRVWPEDDKFLIGDQYMETIVDTTPYDPGSYRSITDIRNAALIDGRSFCDEKLKLEITMLSHTDQSAKVRIIPNSHCSAKTKNFGTPKAYIPLVAKNASVTGFSFAKYINNITIQSTSTYPVSGYITFTNSATIIPFGTSANDAYGPIPSFGMQTFPLVDLPDGYLGAATIYSEQPLVAKADLTANLLDGTQNFTSYRGTPASAATKTVILPSLNCSKDTWISIQNLSDTYNSVSVRTFDPKVQNEISIMIPPKSSQIVSPRTDNDTSTCQVFNLNSGAFYGSATITGSAPITVVANEQGPNYLASYDGVTQTAPSFSAPYVIMNSENWGTKIRIYNSGTADTSVTVKYTPTVDRQTGVPYGTPCEETQPIAAGKIASFGYNAFAIRDPSPTSNTCKDGQLFIGSAISTINTTNQPLAGVVFHQNTQKPYRDVYNLYHPANVGAASIVFPNVDMLSGGAVNSFMIMNTNTSPEAVTCTARGPKSAFVASKTRTLNPQETWYLPNLSSLNPSQPFPSFVGSLSCDSPGGYLIGVTDLLNSFVNYDIFSSLNGL